MTSIPIRKFIGGTQVFQSDRYLSFPQETWGHTYDSWIPCKYNNGRIHSVYLGTWKKAHALLTAEELRNEGFSVLRKGRGYRHGRRGYDLTLEQSTHIAIYIKGEISHARGDY